MFIYKFMYIQTKEYKFRMFALVYIFSKIGIKLLITMSIVFGIFKFVLCNNTASLSLSLNVKKDRNIN